MTVQIQSFLADSYIDSDHRLLRAHYDEDTKFKHHIISPLCIYDTMDRSMRHDKLWARDDKANETKTQSYETVWNGEVNHKHQPRKSANIITPLWRPNLLDYRSRCYKFLRE